MKLSKKLTAIFTPIASISIVAPIATSCGSKTFEIGFGDSINCLDKKKEHTSIAKYHSIKSVHNSSKLLVQVCEYEEFSASVANDADHKTLQSVYGDFIASWSFSGENAFCLECEVEDVTTPTKFVAFNFQEKNQEVCIGENLSLSDFTYRNDNGKMMLKVGENEPILSYKYHLVEATD